MKQAIRKSTRSLNAVSLPAEIIIHIIVGAFSLCCIIPFIFVLIISFTSKESLQSIGYSFFPTGFSLDSYMAAFDLGSQLARSYFNSFLVTAVGTVLSVLICMLYSYGMFRKDYPLRHFFTFFAFFTMMFGGGLAPTVMVCRNLLGMNNNYTALIVPLLVSPFNFIVMRTFYKTTVSESLIESASLDGSGEWGTLFKIVAPISKPGIATIGLLNALAFWNEWYLALLYIKDKDLYPLQYLLMEMQMNIDFIKRNLSVVSASVNLADLPSEGLRMALCAFIVIPIACAYPFFQRYIIAGLTVGAVKE
jgi:putative aldouronate transport system permease protein